MHKPRGAGTIKQASGQCFNKYGANSARDTVPLIKLEEEMDDSRLLQTTRRQGP